MELYHTLYIIQFYYNYWGITNYISNVIHLYNNITVDVSTIIFHKVCSLLHITTIMNTIHYSYIIHTNY